MLASEDTQVPASGNGSIGYVIASYNLTAAPPGSPGLKTQKVTGFADCGGALYVTVNTKLYRRNDDTLPPAPPAGCSCTRSRRSARSTAGCAA